MKILDTNMIIRYFVHDDEESAEYVKTLLRSEKVLILPEVIAEVFYVNVIARVPQIKNPRGCEPRGFFCSKKPKPLNKINKKCLTIYCQIVIIVV